MSTDNLLTTAEVARLLRTSTNEIQQARHDRRDTPPWIKVGRRVLYRRSDVERWLADHLVDPSKVA